MAAVEIDAARAGLATGAAAYRQLIRLSLVVRLIAVVAGTAGLVGEELTVPTLIAVLLLAGTSIAGLAQADLLDLVVEHPLIAMIDLAVVIGVFVALGVDSPLAIGALSTAFLTGVLFPLPVCLLLSGTLLVGYAGAAVTSFDRGMSPGFLIGVGMPVTYVCLIGIGQAFRRIQLSQQHAARRLAEFAQNAATSDERARMAREVHDSLAKSLQGLAFGAAALPSWVERDGERARTEAAALAAGASQAVQDARSLLTRMRTDEPGRSFESVLSEVLRAWSDQSGHEVELDLSPGGRFDADVRYEVLAAVREVLENVRRHAPGATVNVALIHSGTSSQLTVRDDGPGFSLDLRSQRETDGHYGLRGVEERLTSVGGGATFATSPGAGVTVVLAIPATDGNLLARGTS
jgi:signal transduction histidine kinase